MFRFSPIQAFFGLVGLGGEAVKRGRRASWAILLATLPVQRVMLLARYHTSVAL